MNERKLVTLKDIANIEKMVKAHLSISDIIAITGFSDRTVRKIRDGQHFLQTQAKPILQKESEKKEAQQSQAYHNDLLMMYSALCDIRDGIDTLIEAAGAKRKEI